MEKELFDRETVLDLTVNFIPLGILLAFMILYVVFNPFGFDSVISSIQFAIIGSMFVGLAVLTYYSGAAVSRAEKREEAKAEAAGELDGDERDELGGGSDAAELEGDAATESDTAAGEGGDEGDDEGGDAEDATGDDSA